MTQTDLADMETSYPTLNIDVSPQSLTQHKFSSKISFDGLKINPTYFQPSVECGRGEVKLRPVRSMSAQSRVTSSLCRLEIPHWYRSNR